MILELDDGRELRLPDEMPDETARQLKMLIQTLERRAKEAESDSRMLRDEMAALRQQFNTVQAQQPDTAVLNALNSLRQVTEQGLARVFAAASADRQVVADEFGEMTRSRIIM